MTDEELVEFVHHGRRDRFWCWVAELITRYFRVEVEGAENLPSAGPVIVLPNHSGFAGADAIVLAHWLHGRTGRAPKILAHPTYFDFFRLLRLLSESFGLRRAKIDAGVEALRGGDCVILFPEGEQGNFKPSRMRYCLQRFHTGFARMAAKAQVPVVPCVVIGAEDSHLNLGHLDFSRVVAGLKVPLPINLLPLPAKWKIRFLPPLVLTGDAVADATAARSKMQLAICSELLNRPYVYVPKPRWLRI